jgi:hypothetical protein
VIGWAKKQKENMKAGGVQQPYHDRSGPSSHSQSGTVLQAKGANLFIVTHRPSLLQKEPE